MARGPLLTENEKKRIHELREMGLDQTEIAYRLRRCQYSVSKVLGEKKMIDKKLYDELMMIRSLINDV